MILTGEKLAELCRPALGSDWKSELARRFGVSRQTIHAKSRSKIGLSKAFKRKLHAVLEDQLVINAKNVNELAEDLGGP